MAKVTLVGLHYSPWTQRARWALDHHAIGHAYEEYMPVVGEPLLRLRTRKLRGRVSVPVLITPHGSIGDSLAIAKHADSIGDAQKLVDGHEVAVDRWVASAEKALDAARGLTIRAVAASPRAQEESVKLPLPGILKRPTARLGTALLTYKWKARSSDAEAEARIAEVLEELRAALRGKTDGYIDGTFSFADIAMTGVIQAIMPVADEFIPLQPATRETWTRPALAARFTDLVAWRDGLFAKHRRAREAARATA